MHRLGNGNRFWNMVDLENARKRWTAENRTVHTYCLKEEWEAYPDDLGELVHEKEDGTEFRIHATIRSVRPEIEAYRITHNCLLVGRPGEYIRYPMSMRADQEVAFTGSVDPATG